VGNVWQYTDVFVDAHTRAAILRGSSNYRPDGSGWYFRPALELNTHNKYFLMDDSYERSGTVGFRCAADGADICTESVCGTLRDPVSDAVLTTPAVVGWKVWGFGGVDDAVDAMVGARVNVSDVSLSLSDRVAVGWGASAFTWSNGFPTARVDSPSPTGVTAFDNAPIVVTVPIQDDVVVEVYVTALHGVANFLAAISGRREKFMDSSLSSLDAPVGGVYLLRFNGTRPGDVLSFALQASDPVPLRGGVGVPPSAVDLTAEGAEDWVHWGLSSPTSVDRRADGSWIKGMDVLGGATLLQYSNNPVAFSWSNGVPTSSVAASTTGVFVAGKNSGFAITIACGLETLVVRVYVGVYIAQGRFNATLSNSSIPAFVDDSLEDASGTTNGVYTLLVSGGAGQVLHVEWTLEKSDAGNITLQAVTVATAGRGAGMVALQGVVVRSAA
jgi:hypothetical protein